MSYSHHNPAAELERLRHREVSVSDRFVRFTRRGQRELLPPHPSVESEPIGLRLSSRTDHSHQVPTGQHLMPGFQAINNPILPIRVPTITSGDGSASDSEEELPDPSTFVRPRAEPSSNHRSSQEEPSDICGRNWPVEAVIGKREVNGDLEYWIKWEPSTLLSKDIRRRRNGSGYVRCDGNDFDISSDSATMQSQDGKPQRLVMWADTWRLVPDDAVVSLWQAIKEYDIRVLRHGNSGVSYVHFWIKPMRGVNYSQHVRTRLREKYVLEGKTMKPKQRLLIESAPCRHLEFRESFFDEGKEVSFGKEEKADGMLIYDTGDEQLDSCDRCQQGRGPFPKCVVHESFNNGACASCVYARDGPRCNFSKSRKSLSRKRGNTSAASQEIESDDETSPAPTVSLVANSSPRNSPVRSGDESDCTNPTSPIFPSPSQAAARHSCAPSPELGSLPSLVELQQRGEEAPIEDDDEDWDPVKALSVLAPMSSSDQNARSADSQLHNHRESTSALMLPEVGVVSARTENKKRKRAQTPPMKAGRSNLVAELPIVEDLTFYHEACVGRAFCVDLRAGYRSHSARAGPSTHRDTVYRQARFSGGEASSAQIRFILNRCSCPYTAYFQEAWDDYGAEMTKKGKKVKRTKEEHLSKRFFNQINGVINEFCLDEPHASGTAECPINIDD